MTLGFALGFEASVVAEAVANPLLAVCCELFVAQPLEVELPPPEKGDVPKDLEPPKGEGPRVPKGDAEAAGPEEKAEGLKVSAGLAAFGAFGGSVEGDCGLDEDTGPASAPKVDVADV